MLFKNRSIQVSLVKTPTDGAPGEQVHQTIVVDPEALSAIVKSQVQNVAICVGAILIGRQVLSSASTVAIMVADNKLQIANAAAWAAAQAASTKS